MIQLIPEMKKQTTAIVHSPSAATAPQLSSGHATTVTRQRTLGPWDIAKNH